MTTTLQAPPSTNGQLNDATTIAPPASLGQSRVYRQELTPVDFLERAGWVHARSSSRLRWPRCWPGCRRR